MNITLQTLYQNYGTVSIYIINVSKIYLFANIVWFQQSPSPSECDLSQCLLNNDNEIPEGKETEEAC